MIQAISYRREGLAKTVSLLILLFTIVTVQAAGKFSRINVSQTGQLLLAAPPAPGTIHSPDGSYTGSWQTGRVSHDRRELLDFILRYNGKPLYQLEQAPGSDL